MPAGQVVPPPLGVELVAAAAVIEVAATVYSNIELVGLADGDRFLVHGGAGGIGSFAIQYAKSIGATVITTAGTEDKLNYCRSIGADHAISYRGDWPAAVREVAADGVGLALEPREDRARELLADARQGEVHDRPVEEDHRGAEDGGDHGPALEGLHPRPSVAGAAGSVQ